ncbi:hypothetical protein ACEQ8H_005391 [Pleosporales sp. CAS-2024a]
MAPKRARNNDHAYRPSRQPPPGLGAALPRRSRRLRGLDPLPPPPPAPAPQPIVGVVAGPAPIPVGLPAHILTPQQIAANHNMASPFHQFGGAVRNGIYECLMDNFRATHYAGNYQRVPYGIMNPTMAGIVPAAMLTAPYPLFLTPNSDHTTANPYYGLAAAPVNAATLAQDYAAMKRDLLSFGQVCRLTKEEFRSWQRMKFFAFVRAEEMGAYMLIFAPITDHRDPRSHNYSWNPPELVFPWWKDDMHDISPLFDHYRRNHTNQVARVPPAFLPRLAAPFVRALNLTANPAARAHHTQLRDTLFWDNSDTTLPWRDSLISYVTSGLAHRIQRIELRSHGFPWGTSHFAQLNIWFENRPGVGWVDGRSWRIPNYGPNTPEPVLHPGMTRLERKTWEIRQFIRDTGLNDAEIINTWEIRLGVVGRHAVGGLGI